jgi:hypothetical protein
MSRNQEVARIIWETWVRETDGSPIPWEDAPLYAPEDARCVQACAEAITAWNTRAPSALPVSGWRDIATAPPYRVPVLLIAPYPTKTGWTDIYYGWRNAGGSNWDRWPHDFRPTHWMPLPSPPSEPGVK